MSAAEAFERSLAERPEHRACVAALLHHLQGRGGVRVHSTFTNGGDLRIAATSPTGKTRNVFRLFVVRTRGCLGCKTLHLPSRLRVEGTAIDHVRSVVAPLATAFDLTPTAPGAAAQLIAAVEAALECWTTGARDR